METAGWAIDVGLVVIAAAVVIAAVWLVRSKRVPSWHDDE